MFHMWPFLFLQKRLGFRFKAIWSLSIEHFPVFVGLTCGVFTCLMERLGQIQSRPITGHVPVADIDGWHGPRHADVFYVSGLCKFVLCGCFGAFAYGL